MQKPLYPLTCGDLGSTAEEVEKNLKKHFNLASKWDCVMLLDEADVFLARRRSEDLHRNSIVSVFLRMLEYYRGVLFLTTNSVAALDRAIESRIHLKIAYPELDRAARLRVWSNAISVLPPAVNGLDSADLDTLSQRTMNGREIKNVIKSAQLLANGQERPMTLEHVYTVLRITQIGSLETGLDSQF